MLALLILLSIWWLLVEVAVRVLLQAVILVTVVGAQVAC
jgi:hypothetical protein